MTTKTAVKKKVFRVQRVTKKALEAMTPAERRVLIAQDVLARIDSKQLEVRQHLTYLASDRGFSEQEQAHKVLADTECTVCAIGAVFVAAVTRFNEQTMRGLLDRGGNLSPLRERLLDYLKPYFSVDQLSLMEYAFEAYGHYGSWHNRSRHGARLRLIMQNIINNKGTFRPRAKGY